MADGTPQSMEEFSQNLRKVLDFGPEEWLKAADKLAYFANEVNKTFGQLRGRMVELNQAVADSLPGVRRMGGNIENVARTIEDVALASRRNVVANAEDVENLFTATKLLGGSVESLSNAFIDVGVSIEQIPTQLEASMDYIRSIGGNTKQVMSDVTNNMAQMNRFQFEGGVQGLTKMAAQASMLRFNMNETFKLADKVLDPEGAVEVASAFQRLGVAAGNLVDPFALMNQSINDPSGLQTSLANVSKQFTFFDEKSKTFKINPQGVLTLREMERQAGLSEGSLSKMGLAAAELDRRLSAVSAAGLQIADEEDKQFLANIAKIRSDGTYEVTLKDGTKKELAELQQPEFDELIREQKEGPKTLEELGKAQLTTSELMNNNLNAIRDTLMGGALSAAGVVDIREQMRGIVETTLSEYSKMAKPEDVRKETQTLIGSLDQLYKDLKDPNKKGLDVIADFLDKVGGQFEDISKRFTNKLTDTTKKIGEKEAAKSGKLESGFGQLLVKGADKLQTATQNTQTAKSLTLGTDKTALIQGTKTSTKNINTKSEINLGGKITVDVTLPTNFNALDREQQQKILDSIFNSQKFQEMIRNIAADKNPTKAPQSTAYGG